MKINKKIYKTKNHYKTKNPKQQIIISNSLRFGHNHIIRLKNREFGKSKTWPTFSISRDGEIFQHFSDDYHSDFIGIKEVDIKSINIVLENMGWLRKMDNVYYNWLNEVCDKSLVKKKKWMGYEYWEDYTTEQMFSLIELCKFLQEKHNILSSVIEFHHYHRGIKKYRGVVLKSNHIENSTDSNPLLNLEKLKKHIEVN